MKRRITTLVLTLFMILGCLVPATAQAAVPKDFNGISGSYLYVAGKKFKTPSRQLTKVSKYDSVTAAAYTYTTYELDGKTYALTGAGKLKKNMIVGSGEDMYYYDATGARVEDPSIVAAVEFVKEHGGTKTKAAAKLKKCFTYLVDEENYPNQMDESSENFDNAILPVAAAATLKSGLSGDSFVKASAFAYVARVLGYESQVVGCMIADGDGGTIPHGYTGIKHGKTWYIYDVSKNLFKKTVKKYPYNVEGNREALNLVLENGTAVYTGTVESMKNVKAHMPTAVDVDPAGGFHIEDGYIYCGDEKYVGSLTAVPAARSVDSKPYSYFALRINGQEYAFNEQSKMYTNRIVGMGVYAGYYAEDGTRIHDERIDRAIHYVFLHGGTGNTLADKMKTCYKFLGNRENYSYNNVHNVKNCTVERLPDAAMDMLKKDSRGSGNCVSWAAAWCYIARVLGCDVQVKREHTVGYSGEGLGAHGYSWTRDLDGQWKVCDPQQEYKANMYMRPTSKRWFAVQTTFTLETQNGEAKWVEGDTVVY